MITLPLLPYRCEPITVAIASFAFCLYNTARIANVYTIYFQYVFASSLRSIMCALATRCHMWPYYVPYVYTRGKSDTD